MRISEPSTAQTTVTRVKHNAFPQKQSVVQAMKKKSTNYSVTQKQRHTTIRWDKSVKDGLRVESVMPTIKVKSVKNPPLLIQQVQKYTRTQTSESDICNPNIIISPKMQHEKTALSDIGSAFTGRCSLEEERKDIVGASIALLILKKRLWDNTGADTCGSPMKVAKIVCASNIGIGCVIDRRVIFPKEIENSDDHTVSHFSPQGFIQ